MDNEVFIEISIVYNKVYLVNLFYLGFLKRIEWDVIEWFKSDEIVNIGL